MSGSCLCLVALLLATVLPGTIAQALTVTTLSPVADASIYSETDKANGRGDKIEVGISRAAAVRRGLIRFDVSGIPADATVQAASLNLVLDSNNFGPHVVAAHRVTTAWTEGPTTSGTPAESGDVTWLSPFLGSGRTWSNQGGDFFPFATSVATADAERSTVSFNVKEDVQDFLSKSASNEGWLLKIADEGISQSLKRFASREFHDASQHPALVVTWFIPTTTTTGTTTTSTTFAETTTTATTTTVTTSSTTTSTTRTSTTATSSQTTSFTVTTTTTSTTTTAAPDFDYQVVYAGSNAPAGLAEMGRQFSTTFSRQRGILLFRETLTFTPCRDRCNSEPECRGFVLYVALGDDPSESGNYECAGLVNLGIEGGIATSYFSFSFQKQTTFPTADPLPADVEFRKVLAADQVSTFARFSTAWDRNVRLFTEFRGLDFCQARCAAMTECLGVFNFGSDEDKGFIDVCYGLSSLGVAGGAVTSRVCQSFFKFRPGSLGEPITVVSPFVDRNRPVSISDLVSANINGDDLRDVVAIGFSSAIYFLTQNEDGTFSQSKRETSLRTFVTSALSFDLTGDGIEDLVYGSFFDNTLAYYPGSASGYTSQSTLIDDQSLSISAIASGNFSLSQSDGFADLLALNFDESTDTSFVIVYTFGDQNGPTRTEAARLDDAGLRIASGDLDGDGRADAVYLTSSSLLWQSSGVNKVPFVGQPLQLLAMGTGNDVLVAELNGDERNDVVLLRNRNLIFFMNMGDGSLVRNASLSFGAQVGSVTVSAVDLTDDGSLDLVVGSRDFIITFENKGNFVFEELSRRTFAAGTVTFATTGDLNSDGIQDVIVGSVLSGSSSSIVYYPNGAFA